MFTMHGVLLAKSNSPVTLDGRNEVDVLEFEPGKEEWIMKKPLSGLSDRELKERLSKAAESVQYSYRDYDAELLNRKRTRLMVAAILVNAGLVAVDAIIRLVQA